jgi:hypothetical protein
MRLEANRKGNGCDLISDIPAFDGRKWRTHVKSHMRLGISFGTSFLNTPVQSCLFVRLQIENGTHKVYSGIAYTRISRSKDLLILLLY